jgi:purine-binding chemotaxis protein CheW
VVSILEILVTPTPLQRALGAAPDRATVAAARPEQEFFMFRLGDLMLGVPSQNVREVTRMGPMTPLPRMSAAVLGVVGHRGEVLPVVDLLRFLGVGELKPAPRARIFIGVAGALSAAFMADAVIGLRKVFTADIWPAPVTGQVPAELLLGIVTTDREGEGAINLLNLVRVLQSARQRAVAR